MGLPLLPAPILPASLFLLLLLAAAAPAQEAVLPFGLTWTSEDSFVLPADRPDLHAPIGILGDHPQELGTWMFSYRYFRSDHDGLIEGEGDLSREDVFARGFTEAPDSFVRETHLFSALYGFDDRISLLLTVPWISNRMDSTTFTGKSFETRTTGLGDVRVTGLYSLRRKQEEHFELSLGLSLPSGSTDERDATPNTAGLTLELPYPMQLGSGTWDLHPGLTYVRFEEDVSFGAQATHSTRLGRNSDDYALGDVTEFTAWVARTFQEDLSGSLRIAYRHEGRIDGADDAIARGMSPAGDPRAQGGDRVEAFVGVNYTRPGGHRFAAELGGPLSQDRNGPQVEADVLYSLGWQFSF